LARKKMEEIVAAQDALASAKNFALKEVYGAALKKMMRLVKQEGTEVWMKE